MQRNRIIGWSLAGIVLVVVVALVGGYLYLRSGSFQQFALHKIAEEANQATGGRTQIGRLDFSLSTLTAHLYNIVIRGTEDPSSPPLLQMDELTVGLKIQSVLHRKIYLSELLVQHPVVHVQVDRQGKNNFPQAPPSQSSSHTDVFDLGIRHLALSNGEINYNDRKTPLDADLYDLNTDVTFNPFATQYSGTISYNNGHLQYGQYAPMPHSFNARFNATRSAFSLQSAVAKVASSSMSLRADVTNYANPTVAGEYDVHIHTQDFAALSPQAKPAGDVSISGKIRYSNQNNQPFLQAVSVTGQISSDGLVATASNGRLDIRRLKGDYQLANGNLKAQEVEVDSLGGKILASLDMRHLDTTPASRAQVTLHTISLQAIQHSVHGAQLSQATLSGSIDGTANASWTGSLTNLLARADLTVRADARSKSDKSTTVPVNGAVHAVYDGPKNILTVRQSSLTLPATTITADGEVSRRSRLQVHAQAHDLHQLAVLASSFTSQPSSTPLVSGSAALDATVQGSLQKPQISGQLNAQNLNVQGSQWKTATVSLAASPSRITVTNGELVSATRGRASFDATVVLRNWSYVPSNSIHAHLSAQQLSITDLERVANAHYPVSGDLSANLSLDGSQLQPSGSGTANIANARAYDEPIRQLALKFQAANGSISSTLNVSVDAGSANTTLTFNPQTKAYKLKLDMPSIALEKLHMVQARNIPVNGTLTASASGEGTLDNPQLTATVQVPKLEMRQQSIAGLKAEVHVADKRANLTVDSEVVHASIRARGQMELAGDYQTDASIDTSSIPLDALLTSFSASVPQGFQGQTELHATLKGPLKDKTRLEAHLTIPTLNASYQQLQVGAARPIRADYAHSVLTLQPSEIRGTDTALQFQGSLPFAGTTPPSLNAKGSVNLRLLNMFAHDLRSSGTIALDVRATGSSKTPTIQGQIQVHDVAMIAPGAPLGVDKLNGKVDLTTDRLQISSMSAQVGGGQVSVAGSVVYRPSVQFDLALQGNSVRLRYPEGLRTVLDSNLTFSGNMQASTLNGRVLIDTLSFTPEFDLASFGDQFSSSTATPSEPGFADTINLAIGVQSKQNLSATSSQVSVEGGVDLRVSGTAANPVITGRTDLNAGELFYRNVRYQLQRGVITFDDPNQTHPNLNVSVAAKVQQYDLTINLRGPVDRLTTSYSSDPPLATADIINLVAFGKTTSESAASSASQSTDSMIASGAQSAIGSGVGSGLQKLAGISSIQIDPLIGGNNQNPGASIALQQRVTKNFLFTFSTNVAQPGQEMVEGDYQITKRWSVSVARDQLGGVSVDGRFHTKF